MIHLFRSRVTLVWMILVGATAISWEAGHGVFASRRQAQATIIAVAFIKVRFVILDFMEIRNAPLPMRLVGELWVLLVGGALLTLYLSGR